MSKITEITEEFVHKNNRFSLYSKFRLVLITSIPFKIMSLFIYLQVY